MRKPGGKKPGTVRIIGGRWRGRKLPVADLPGLRPSGDRGRETLFNWLQAHVRGARCVDLFAGTGVLGLEAASRGAQYVVLIEKAPVAAQVIGQNVETLSSDPGPAELRVVNADAIAWLETCEPESIDIVFIDPPFGSNLEEHALHVIDQRNCLADGGFVYLETTRQAPEIELPAGWKVEKEKRLGEVRMRLLKNVRGNLKEIDA